MRGSLPVSTLTGPGTRSRHWFVRFSGAIAHWAGTSSAFVVAALVVMIWAVSGPLFHYSDTWQLVINTGTTIVTFLMVFLIQNTQNRDARAIHLKLDELIRAVDGVRNKMMDLERLSDEELMELRQQFDRISRQGETRRKETANDSRRSEEIDRR